MGRQAKTGLSLIPALEEAVQLLVHLAVLVDLGWGAAQVHGEVVVEALEPGGHLALALGDDLGGGPRRRSNTGSDVAVVGGRAATVRRLAIILTPPPRVAAADTQLAHTENTHMSGRRWSRGAEAG